MDTQVRIYDILYIPEIHRSNDQDSGHILPLYSVTARHPKSKHENQGDCDVIKIHQLAKSEMPLSQRVRLLFSLFWSLKLNNSTVTH